MQNGHKYKFLRTRYIDFNMRIYERDRRVIEGLGEGFDGISSTERQRRSISSRKVFALCDTLIRGSENFKGAELAPVQLSIII
jgi:hypothetical protein